MTSVILALMLAASGPTCPPIAGKVFHEPFNCKPGLVKTQCGGKTRCLPPDACPENKKPTAVVAPKPVEEAKPTPPPPPPKVVVAPPVIVKVAPPPPPPERWHHGPYIELGTSFINPRNVLDAKNGGAWTMLEGNLGYHAHYMPWHLGGRLYMSNFGGGAELQGYLIQGEKLEWHVFAGPRWVGGPFNYPSVIDVYRRWDITWGTGVEYPLTKHWVLTGDLRVSTALYHQSEQGWSYEATHVFTNELKQVRLLGGVMYRF